MDVGVRELKQKLSEFLERAAQGEVIRVTDRGLPKAILGPLPGVERMALGIAQGWIRPAADTPPVRVRRFKAAVSSSAVLDEDRGT